MTGLSRYQLREGPISLQRFCAWYSEDFICTGWANKNCTMRDITNKIHGAVFIGPPSACMYSIRSFITVRSCTKMAKPRITLTTPHDSSGTLVFRCQNLGEIPTTSPPTGAPNRGGIGLHRCFSTNISLYLRNGAR